MAQHTYHYVGRTSIDLDDGKGNTLTLLPGGLYMFDSEKDKGKILLLRKVPKGDLRNATPEDRKRPILAKVQPPQPLPAVQPQPPPPQSHSGTDTSHGKGKGR